MNDNSIKFACPACGYLLEQLTLDEQYCSVDLTHFYRIDGIWRFLLPPRAQALAKFIREYETIRAAEGRGSDDSSYYRALPFADLTGRLTADWRIRAISYNALIERVLEPRETRGSPLTILDLGAGNGWLSYRLAQRGHTLAAVDLLVNVSDGLGARVHYDLDWTCIQAEFDCLPLAGNQADLIIFNSSFHYSADYESTLKSVRRILKPDGAVIILDTPVYSNGASGASMVAERQAQFVRAYGFSSDGIKSENYLTYDRLHALGRSTGFEWDLSRPFRGLRWATRPWLARLRKRREPAEFLLIVGKSTR